MDRRRSGGLVRRSAALAVAVALFAPSVSVAAGRVQSTALVGPASATAPADAYENDDTSGTARDLTALFGWFGEGPYTETHTFDIANDSDGGDEDWFRFDIGEDEMAWAQSYLFEAVSEDPFVDPVIEIYGPTVPNPTAPEDLGEDPETAGVTQLDPTALLGSDDGVWFDKRSASVSLVPTQIGTYWVRVRPYRQYTGGLYEGYRDGAGTYTLRAKIGQMTRLSGATRITTAVQISRERFPSIGPDSRAAIVASGYSFPDALAGSTLAGVLEAPMLLTSPTTLSAEVRDELQRLAVEKVYLLGGEGAVSSSVEDAIAGLAGVSVERVEGSTRVQTAIEVARTAAGIGDTANLAFVVNSQSYPDALAASPIAVFNGAPVLLTGKDWLNLDVAAALKDPALGITDVVIVGGTGVIGSGVQTTLTGMFGPTHVRRVAGATRYATAREVAVWATGSAVGEGTVGTAGTPDALWALDFNRIGVASGANFPDALAGGVFCGLSGAPILLTPRDSVSPYIFADYDPYDAVLPGDDYLGSSDLALVRSYLFGGAGVVTDAVLLSMDIITGPVPY